MKKFLSAVLCILLIISAVSCTPTPDQPSQPIYDEQKALYADIISEYTRLIIAKRNGEELPVPNVTDLDEREAYIAEALYDVVNSCIDAEKAELLGYSFKDMDKNGILELLLLSKYTTVHAVFTLSDDVPILLETTAGRDYIALATRNRFLIRRDTSDDNIEQVTYYTCHVDGDKMTYDSIYGLTRDRNSGTVEMFQVIDGDRRIIDQSTYDDLHWEHLKAQQTGYELISKRICPRIYFPLNDPVINEDLPVADFSSYDAIRETFKKISACLDEFNSSAWFRGEYDDLFYFPTDLSFEYYTQLLYAAYNGRCSLGYDEIDLNGDGQDELVFMNEDYRIKAIFTQRNGIPELLDAFGYETCWLDDQGFIHVDREEYRDLEYSLYEFTKKGDYNLVYSILVTNMGTRYLAKDGKTEKISFEESLKVYYDDYCRYSEPFEPNEQTRNISSLTYTPLTESAEDSAKAAFSKIWYKYSNLEKSSDKDHARAQTYISFEDLTDTKIRANIKYVFTFSYPSPEDEYYYLSDSTESFLSVTVDLSDGRFISDEHGIKGRIEFGHDVLWLIIEESTDQRFQVGYHCYDEYIPEE